MALVEQDSRQTAINDVGRIHRDRTETRAADEHIPPETGNAGGNRDIAYVGVVKECIIPDIGDRIAIHRTGDDHHTIQTGVTGDGDGGVIGRVSKLVGGEVRNIGEVRRRHRDRAWTLGVTTIGPTGENPAIGCRRNNCLRGADPISTGPADGPTICWIRLHRDRYRRRGLAHRK